MLTINYHPTTSGGKIGEIILNNPTALNAFSPSDAIALTQIISEWRDDESIMAVVLRGAGERAFCAGGDVRSVYSSIIAKNMDEVDAYFADEYRADYALHCFAKPIIAFAHGIVMGGGMGLLQGCNIRIVTPQTKMAMPEHKIGFFPDVGAAFFAKRFNGAPQTGYYMGLSGRIFSGEEALALRAADIMTAAEDYESLLAALKNAAWTSDATANLQIAHGISNQLASAVSDDYAGHPKFINDMYDDVLSDNLQSAIDRFPEKELAVVAAGSPLSHKVWAEYYCRRHTFLPPPPANASFAIEPPSSAVKENLRETFVLDYILAMNMTRRGDFSEGVRALLIDKDNHPQWQAPHDDATVAAMFESPYPEKSHAFLQSLKDIG